MNNTTTATYVVQHQTTKTTHGEDPNNYGFTFCGKSTMWGPLFTVEDETPITCKKCAGK